MYVSERSTASICNHNMFSLLVKREALFCVFARTLALNEVDAVFLFCFALF